MNSELDGAGVDHAEQVASPHLRMLMTQAGTAPALAISWTQTAHERSAALRRDRIAVAAYHLAQARGFAPGHDAEDWLLAESQIDAADAANS